MMLFKGVLVRTTLNLDEDVLDKARLVAGRSNRALRMVINEALRLGLDLFKKNVQKKPYQTHPRAMKLRLGYSLDNIQELLSKAEGEDFR